MSRTPLRIIALIDVPQKRPLDYDYTEELEHSEDWKAEGWVIEALKQDLGHEVKIVGVFDDLNVLLEQIDQYKPDIVFNMVEQFRNDSTLEQNVVGLLELLEIPYTGTGSVGLVLCKNKGITKKILNYHRIKTAPFSVIPKGRKVQVPRRLRYPMIVKPLREEASYGISQKSFVENDKDFIERVQFVHESMGQDALVEEYIDGREIYVSLLGNQRLQVFPFREMIFSEVPDEEPKFATFKAKWDETYRKRWGIQNRFVPSLPADVSERIAHICKRVYRNLYIKGYGRIDIRLTPENDVVVLEANPNPHIAKDEDYAMAARKAGMEYPELIQRIVNHGLEGRRKEARREGY